MLMSRHQTAGQIIMYRLVENPLKMLRSWNIYNVSNKWNLHSRTN
jgi:hypothetical protein